MAGFSGTASRILTDQDLPDNSARYAIQNQAIHDEGPLAGLQLTDVEMVPPHVNSKLLAQALLKRQQEQKPWLARMLSTKPHTEVDESESDSSDTGESDAERTGRCLGLAARCLKLARERIPALQWISGMTCTSIQADVLSGIIVCIMVIPQSMSYANIAGLPFYVGMYAASVPTLVYALFGHSRQLAVGPVAMVSLVLRAGLHSRLTHEQCPEWFDLRDAGCTDMKSQNKMCPNEYASLVLTVTFIVGVANVLACIFKMSVLVSFLGHPMISGFSTGSAIIIGFSQLKYFFGVSLPNTEHVIDLAIALAEQLPDAKPAPLILGVMTFAFLMTLKQLSKKHAKLKMLAAFAPLMCCLGGSLLVWGFPVLHEKYSVAYVGKVPSGLMPLSWDKIQISWQTIKRTQAVAASVTLVGFMESIAIAKSLAGQHGYSVNAGQELLALGLANIAGSLFSGFPVTGSFSRSAVANTTGAQSQFAGFVTGVAMLLVLAFLTPIFYYLPMFVLAAIVLNAVTSLLAYDVAIELYRVKKWDFGLWMVAFVGTLLVGPLEGIGLAVLMSLGVVIYEAVRPQLTILWRVPGTAVFRSIDQESSGEFVPYVFIVRIGSSMYFANASYVKDALITFLQHFSASHETQYLILEFAGVRSLDATATDVLRDIVAAFRSRGIETAFAMVLNRPFKTMKKAHLIDFVGESWFFPSVHFAVRGCLKHKAGLAHPGKSNEPMHFNFVTSHPEIGISNDLHHTFTTVSISLPRPYEGLTSKMVNLFQEKGCKVVDSQVCASFLQLLFGIVKNDAKLDAKDRRNLRKSIDELIEGQVESQSPSADALATRQASDADDDQTSRNRQRIQSLIEALAHERIKMEDARQKAEELEAELSRCGQSVYAAV